MTPEERREADWLKETERYPEDVRDIARRYQPWRCWKTTENPAWHYQIYTYSRHRQTGEVRLTLIHGSGDPLAGVATYGQRVEQLIPCDCGTWKFPTEAEIIATKRRLGHPSDATNCGHDSPWKPPA